VATNGNTFRAIAEEVFIKQQNEGRAEATLEKLRWLLEFAYPLLADRPISDITAPELLAVLRKVEIRGRYETARRLRSTCGMGGLLRAIEGYDGHAPTKAALRLAPLVFVRPVELRHAEWSEFDLSSAQWSIPAHKMKMPRPHRVPLAKQSIAKIQEFRKITGDGRWVFPSVRSAAPPDFE